MSRTAQDSIKALASRLRSAREAKNLSQTRLAELAVTSQVEIGRIEAGKSARPNAYVIARLCSVLGCSIDWMMTPRRIVEADPC